MQPPDTAIHAMGLISVDGSMLVQMGIFFTLLFLLNRLLFRPVLESITQREARTVGARQEAADLRADAEAKMASYEAEIAKARAEAIESKKVLRETGTKRQAELLDTVRSETRDEVERARAEVESASTEARAGIETAATELSGKIVARLLGTGAALLLVLAPAAALAGGGGGGSGFPWKDIAFAAINLAILLFLFVRMGKQPVSDFLHSRRDEILKELDSAKALREEAAAMLGEYKGRLDAVETERQEILDKFRSDGRSERDRIVAEAEAAAERMRVDAKRQIDQEIRRAKLELEGEVVARAVALATDALRGQVTPGQQSKLVDDFVGRLGDEPGNGRA
jgi:F-type H+-transporting ATPase subunit b